MGRMINLQVGIVSNVKKYFENIIVTVEHQILFGMIALADIELGREVGLSVMVKYYFQLNCCMKNYSQ